MPVAAVEAVLVCNLCGLVRWNLRAPSPAAHLRTWYHSPHLADFVQRHSFRRPTVQSDPAVPWLSTVAIDPVAWPPCTRVQTSPHRANHLLLVVWVHFSLKCRGFSSSPTPNKPTEPKHLGHNQSIHPTKHDGRDGPRLCERR